MHTAIPLPLPFPGALYFSMSLYETSQSTERLSASIQALLMHAYDVCRKHESLGLPSSLYLCRLCASTCSFPLFFTHNCRDPNTSCTILVSCIFLSLWRMNMRGVTTTQNLTLIHNAPSLVGPIATIQKPIDGL